MSTTTTPSRRAELAATLILGALTLVLYVALFHEEGRVMAASTRGHWAFVIPIAIAFVFSLVHGAFTARFWASLGIAPRAAKKA